jgi:hypothetical protein
VNSPRALTIAKMAHTMFINTASYRTDLSLILLAPWNRCYLLIVMRFLILFSLGAALFAPASSAQETSPTPTPAPESEASPGTQQTVPEFSPIVPAEPQAPADLLPESNTLPEQPPNGPAPYKPMPYDLLPRGGKAALPGLQSQKPSAEQLEKDKTRFRQLRTIAARNPYAIYIFDRAKFTKTAESKREYMRAYYESLCNEMRHREPRLKATIDAFENFMVSRVIQHNIKPTIPMKDFAAYQAAERTNKQR